MIVTLCVETVVDDREQFKHPIGPTSADDLGRREVAKIGAARFEPLLDRIYADDLKQSLVNEQKILEFSTWFALERSESCGTPSSHGARRNPERGGKLLDRKAKIALQLVKRDIRRDVSLKRTRIRVPRGQLRPRTLSIPESGLKHTVRLSRG